jgi:F5/8 type C domain
MIQALAALVGAGLTLAACYSAGALLIDGLDLKLRRPERFPLAFFVGAACLHLAVFVILAAQIAYWPVLVGLLAGVVAMAVAQGSWRIRGDSAEPLSRNIKVFCSVLFGAFSILYLFNAWAPEMSPDGSAYHLGLVARYLRAHGFERITTNIYAGLSAGVEMLYVPAFAIGRHSAAALVHFGFTVALALAMLAYGRRIGKPWAGAAGALLTYASPVVGVDGTSAYIDVAVAATAFGAFYWLQVWDDLSRDSNGATQHVASSNRALIPVGLLAGYCFAAKYTAFLMVPFAIGFVLWRSRKLGPALRVAVLALPMIAPWMLKDWIILRNPIAPFGNQIFRNPNWRVSVEEEYRDYYRSYDLKNKWTLPLEVTVRGGITNGYLGPVFLLAPLALLALRQRAGRRLLAAGATMFVPYFANVGTRFLIPCLPFVSLALALALDAGKRQAPMKPAKGAKARVGTFLQEWFQRCRSWRVLLVLLMLVHAATSWPAAARAYSKSWAWRLNTIPVEAALRIIPQDKYLREHDSGYGLARMVDEYVPKGERVLALNDLPWAYTSRDVLVSFQGGYNETLADIFNVGWMAAYQPRVLETYKFAERRIRRIRALQTALGAQGEQWSVQELRFFDHGAELPRAPEWRLRAWPNPWDVQLAFDNSDATRWRTWERAAPGDYIDVDFGTTQKIDELRIERSSDYNRIQIQIEVMTDASGWTKLLATHQDSGMQPHGNIRRAATYELAARGIHYLMLYDTDYGAADVRGDPAAWGLTEIAKGYGARIYRVNP